MNGNVLGKIAGVWRLAAEFARDRRYAFQTMREFEALDHNESKRILAEAGLGAADFREAVSRPFAFEDLMSKGMESIGIDPHEFAACNGDWFRYLEHNCALCRVRGRCQQVMSHSEFAARFHEFCPNSADFDQILAAGDVCEPQSDRSACIH